MRPKITRDKQKNKNVYIINKTNGITLMSLIITIILLLILLAINIDIVLDGKVFNIAQKTANETEIKVNKQQDKVDNLILEKNKIENQTLNNQTLVDLPTITSGQIAIVTSKYQTAIIPAGFTVSNIEGEKTVSEGLVIYDIPKTELNEVTWDGTEKTKYNQFVWIPVEINKNFDKKTRLSNFYATDWKENEERGTQLLDEINTDIVEISNEIVKLKESIFKYGGFYFARYEAGSTEERNSTSNSNDLSKLAVKQDMYPYNYVKWGSSKTNVTSEGAIYLSNNLYNGPRYGAKSMACTGAAWDAMLDFVKDDTHQISDSTAWGNYYISNISNTFKPSRGKAAIYSGSDNTLGEFQNVLEHQSSSKNSFKIYTTGITTMYSSKNIYDVAGNCLEWTTEFQTGNSYNARGGIITNNGIEGYASIRSEQEFDNCLGVLSFRPILYIK